MRYYCIFTYFSRSISLFHFGFAVFVVLLCRFKPKLCVYYYFLHCLFFFITGPNIFFSFVYHTFYSYYNGFSHYLLSHDARLRQGYIYMVRGTRYTILGSIINVNRPFYAFLLRNLLKLLRAFYMCCPVKTISIILRNSYLSSSGLVMSSVLITDKGVNLFSFMSKSLSSFSSSLLSAESRM